MLVYQRVSWCIFSWGEFFFEGGPAAKRSWTIRIWGVQGPTARIKQPWPKSWREKRTAERRQEGGLKRLDVPWTWWIMMGFGIFEGFLVWLRFEELPNQLHEFHTFSLDFMRFCLLYLTKILHAGYNYQAVAGIARRRQVLRRERVKSLRSLLAQPCAWAIWSWEICLSSDYEGAKELGVPIFTII